MIDSDATISSRLEAAISEIDIDAAIIIYYIVI